MAVRRALLVALALAAFVAVASAQKAAPAPTSLVQRVATIEREVAAGPGEILRLYAGPHGGVQVSAWRDRKVRIEARVEINAPTEADLDVLTKVIGIVVDPSRTSVDVTTKGPHDKLWMKNVKDFPKRLREMPWRVDYVVWVPEYTSVALEVYDGETLVDGVNGVHSIVSLRGDIRLASVSGGTRASTDAGNVTIVTHDRSWRGGILNASASGNIAFSAPVGFSSFVNATAPGGVVLAAPDERKDLGKDFKDSIGVGGSSVTLVAGGKIEISLVPRD